MNIYLRFDYALNYGIMLASGLWDSIFTEINLATYSQCCSSEPSMKFRADTQRFKSIFTLRICLSLVVYFPFGMSENGGLWWKEGILEWMKTTHWWRWLWTFLVIGKLKAGKKGGGEAIVSVSIQGWRPQVGNVLGKSNELWRTWEEPRTSKQTRRVARALSIEVRGQSLGARHIKSHDHCSEFGIHAKQNRPSPPDSKQQ